MRSQIGKCKNILGWALPWIGLNFSLGLCLAIPTAVATPEPYSVQIAEAIALQRQGFYSRAYSILNQVAQNLQAAPNSKLKVMAFLNLGNTLRVAGQLEEANKVLEQSKVIANQLNLADQKIMALVALGIVAKAQQKPAAALNFFQTADRLNCQNPAPCLPKLQANLEQLSLISNNPPLANAEVVGLVSQIKTQLAKLPANSQTAYAQIYLAESLIRLDQLAESTQVLTEVIQSANSLSDRRPYSYALGTLGKAHEKNKQWQSAETISQKALAIAQAINAPDLAYQWQWQLGRIYKATGKPDQAIAIYTAAYKTLQLLRRDLAVIGAEMRSSFRETVEPVYRQLLELFFDQASSPTQADLITARQVLESLQLAELENFLRQACLDLKPQSIDQFDPTAAIIYPILLPQSLEVIVAIPGQPLFHYRVAAPQPLVEQTVKQMLRSLRQDSFIEERLPPATTIYNWLIKPAEAQFQRYQIKSLVFVLDGSLRNLPLAAAYDGKQYLVEKYNLALAPSLQLLAPKSNSSDRRTLFAGLSQPNAGFAALPGVEQELAQIKLQVPVEKLLNQEFTIANLADQIRNRDFPIVHLATHGQFSSQPEETFLLAWDQKINSNQLEQILRSKESDPGLQQAIELLILSACETASGDDRAALGLAGMSVRSGARSTIATLWAVQDKSTAELMIQLYQELFKPHTSKAQALRQAQLSLLANPRYRHPYFWSPFILVGNWL